MSDVHIVARGDTLSKIAATHGKTVAELVNLNHLPDPDKLSIGQTIMLNKEKVLGVQALILDKDRNPIKGQPYRFEFAGKIFTGITGLDGLTDKIMTLSPQDEVRILIEKLDRSYKEVASVISGYGNKLVTLISPSIKVEATTAKHPNVTPGQLPDKKEPVTPIFDPKAKQPATADKKELGPKATPTTTPDGKPLTKVEGDIPDLDLFLDQFIGGEITDADIQRAAKELGCEAGLIFAIAKQESSASSFFLLGKRKVPKILYERHWFRKLTKPSKAAPSPYEKTYPDICGPAYHPTKKDKKTKIVIDVVTGKAPVADDIYGPADGPQYKRLLKAFQLNQDAALQACSWGKFQIMGFNFKAAGFSDVKAFTRAMSRSDTEHIKAFLKFAKSNSTLLAGLRNKNFEKIAEGHNGAQWKTVNPHYAANIEKFYKEYNSK